MDTQTDAFHLCSRDKLGVNRAQAAAKQRGSFRIQAAQGVVGIQENLVQQRGDRT
jgi:hypothetical protein